jgi:hypothetical protein
MLDLDLDFFVWPPFRDRPKESRLPTVAWRQVASEDEVRSFLERQCHLSRQVPMPGREAEQHQEAFNVWSQWIDNETITAPFEVAHIDAHSDLGSGLFNRSCTFIERELLGMSLEERRHPAFGPDHLNSGNYLLGVIANRWMSRLTYVYPAERLEAEPVPRAAFRDLRMIYGSWGATKGLRSEIFPLGSSKIMIGRRTPSSSSTTAPAIVADPARNPRTPSRRCHSIG